ncbi:MAG: rhomboid family intramembrane serine protease [Spirochaetia bacterium]|nr:rhomboid family intramembrane serine protease [Spirochaetia bacterium]
MKIRDLLSTRFRYVYKNCCLYIIIANVIVFLLTSMNSRLASYLAMNPINVAHHNMYWQFITYMFVHGSFSHLFFNMLGLYFFGTAVEQSVGSKEFLLFYLLCGALAGVFSYFVYVNTGYFRVFLLGASGALFAVLLAYAVIFPDSTVFLFGIVPMSARMLILGYTVLEIVYQLTGYNAGVAHLTHLGGFAFAYLYFVIRFRVNPADRLFGRRR